MSPEDRPRTTPFVALTRHGPPLGASLPPTTLRFDPQRVADAAFLLRLRALDEAFFGPRGQAMPSWVLYDCALAPGLVAGLAARAADLPEASGANASDDELVPVAMVTLLPLPSTSRQLVHTLAWRGDVSFARAALELADLASGSSPLRVIAGWSSPELALFAERGPLRLITAWTPAHDVLATVTADLDPGATPDLELDRLAVPPEPTDTDGLQVLQAALEAGEPRYLVATGAGFRLATPREVTP
jgi:hypothetical protein